MTLFVREDCKFCDKVKDIKSITLLTVKSKETGPMVDLGDTMLPLPPQITGLPALLDGSHLFIGEQPILEHLNKAGVAL